VRQFVLRSRGEAHAEADRIRTQAAARHAAASTPRDPRTTLSRRKAAPHRTAQAAAPRDGTLDRDPVGSPARVVRRSITARV
jgi:hypothetical protein